MKLVKNKTIVLLAILIIGIFFRVYHLGSESIWLDEGISILYAKEVSSQIIQPLGNNPPLYYIILNLWIKLFGKSEFSIRFPSVIFGFLAIFIMYKVGRLIFDRSVGILGSLILGLSVFHIQYSQEARTYSLTVFLTLLSIFFFVKLLKKWSFIVLAGYILSSILLIYSHIFGLLIILAQNIYLLTLFLLSKDTYKLNLKKWILAQSILVVSFIPWIKIFVSRVKIVQGGFWIPSPSFISIASTFTVYSGSGFLMVLFLILSFLSIITYEKIRGNIDRKNIFESIENYCWKIRFLNTKTNYLLLVWLFTPIILPFIVSRFSTPIYSTKYSIVGSLAFYLLVASAISRIRFKYIKPIMISIVVVFSLMNIWKYYSTNHKEQWRDVVNYVETNAKNGDLLLFHAGYCQDFVFDYYSKRTDLVKKQFPEEKTGYAAFKIDKKELMKTVKDYNRVWFILSHSVDRENLIIRTLLESYNSVRHKKYKGIEVYFLKEKA